MGSDCDLSPTAPLITPALFSHRLPPTGRRGRTARTLQPDSLGAPGRPARRDARPARHRRRGRGRGRRCCRERRRLAPGDRPKPSSLAYGRCRPGDPGGWRRRGRPSLAVRGSPGSLRRSPSRPGNGPRRRLGEGPVLRACEQSRPVKHGLHRSPTRCKPCSRVEAGASVSSPRPAQPRERKRA